MVVQDKIRSSLYTQLETSFGAEEAGLLMEAVPPLGWSSLVTHDHLDARVAQIDARFDGVDARFDGVDARFDRVDSRFAVVDARLGAIEDTMRTMVTTEYLDARMERLGREFVSAQLRMTTWLGTLMLTFAGVMMALVLRAT